MKIPVDRLNIILIEKKILFNLRKLFLGFAHKIDDIESRIKYLNIVKTVRLGSIVKLGRVSLFLSNNLVGKVDSDVFDTTLDFFSDFCILALWFTIQRIVIKRSNNTDGAWMRATDPLAVTVHKNLFSLNWFSIKSYIASLQRKLMDAIDTK